MLVVSLAPGSGRNGVGAGKAGAAVAVRGPKVPAVPTIDPGPTPLVRAMVGNGGAAVAVAAGCLAGAGTGMIGRKRNPGVPRSAIAAWLIDLTMPPPSALNVLVHQRRSLCRS